MGVSGSNVATTCMIKTIQLLSTLKIVLFKVILTWKEKSIAAN